MANEVANKEKGGMVALKKMLDNQNVRKQFEGAQKEKAGLYIAEVIYLASSDANLQLCKPIDIVRIALNASTLGLSLNKQLGEAYIVPFREKGIMKPVFIIGYKGLMQLTIGTGQCKRINPGKVYEGEIVNKDRITGDITITGTKKSDKVIGYFAYIELIKGFKKIIYKTKDEIVKFAERYSKSYNSKYSLWKTDFDKMAEKTVLRELIGKYAPKSGSFLGVENDMTESNDNNNNNDDIIEVEASENEYIEPAETAEPEATTPSAAQPGF